jgi:hypothetical protein
MQDPLKMSRLMVLPALALVLLACCVPHATASRGTFALSKTKACMILQNQSITCFPQVSGEIPGSFVSISGTVDGNPFTFCALSVNGSVVCFSGSPAVSEFQQLPLSLIVVCSAEHEHCCVDPAGGGVFVRAI